jgi:hypothetical protein
LIFKLMNSSHVVALIMRPQATRGGGSNISFLPSMMEEFMGGCEDVAAFENLVTSEEESFPASQLWQQARLCLMIFKILEGNPAAKSHQQPSSNRHIGALWTRSLAAKEEMDTSMI